MIGSRVIVLIIFAGFLTQACAEPEDGGYAGAFLQLGLSARAVGMGQAYYAVADDATAIFYNPAGTAHVMKRTVGFSYRAMDLDRRLGYSSINFPVRDEATIAIGWIFAGVSDVLERNTLGEPGDELDCSDNVLAVCFARRFSDIVAVGATGKYHISKLANVTTTTVGFDVGTSIRLVKGRQLGDASPIDMLRIGFMTGNVGASYIWTTGEYWVKQGELGDSQTDDFPLLIGGGVAATALDGTLLVAADARKYSWSSATLHMGAEYVVRDMLKLRAGLDDQRPTFGFGIEKVLTSGKSEGDPSSSTAATSGSGVILTIDYAFSSPKTVERPDHIFSIGFAF